MDISLTPQELRALLVPPLRLFHHGQGPREPLDLDAMTPNAIAGAINDLDREELGAQRTLVVTLADLAQAQEELARTTVLLDERRHELEMLVAKIRAISHTQILEANAVIDRAGAQVLDLARIFLLEVGLETWYEGVRTSLRELVSTLGVEVDDAALEQALQPPERTVVEQTPAPIPPAGFEDLVAPAVNPLEPPLVLEPKPELDPPGLDREEINF